MQQWEQYLQAEMDFTEPMKSTVDHICHIYLEERLKNEGTIASARTVIKHIRRHLGNASLEVLHEKPHILVKFFKNFPEPKWSPKYVYNYRLTLRAAISYYCKSRNLNIGNPMNVVFLDPETAIREAVPTPEEYAMLLESADKHAPAYVRDLLCAAWETGLRKGEILAWSWEHMDMTFLQGIPAYTVWITKQKRKAARQIPMTRELYDMLHERWCAAGRPAKGWVFPVLTPPNRILKRVFKRAGLSHLTIHDMRKSYKTMRKSEGWTKEITMAVQGHATDSMDNYYTIFGRKHLEKWFEKNWSRPIDNNQKMRIINASGGF